MKYDIYAADSYCDELFGETDNFTHVKEYVAENGVELREVLQILTDEGWLWGSMDDIELDKYSMNVREDGTVEITMYDEVIAKVRLSEE